MSAAKNLVAGIQNYLSGDQTQDASHHSDHTQAGHVSNDTVGNDIVGNDTLSDSTAPVHHATTTDGGVTSGHSNMANTNIGHDHSSHTLGQGAYAHDHVTHTLGDGTNTHQHGIAGHAHEQTTHQFGGETGAHAHSGHQLGENTTYGRSGDQFGEGIGAYAQSSHRSGDASLGSSTDRSTPRSNDHSAASHVKDSTGLDRDVQTPDQGPDPNLVGAASGHVKLSGNAAPGSHSAVFGLTPDGRSHDDISHQTTSVGPAHSKHHSMAPRPDASSGLAEQIHRLDQEPKGLERTDPVREGHGSGGKPGAGFGGLPPQGSGSIPSK